MRVKYKFFIYFYKKKIISFFAFHKFNIFNLDVCAQRYKLTNQQMPKQ